MCRVDATSRSQSLSLLSSHILSRVQNIVRDFWMLWALFAHPLSLGPGIPESVCPCFPCSVKRSGLVYTISNTWYPMRVCYHRYQGLDCLRTATIQSGSRRNCMLDFGYSVPRDTEPEAFKLCGICSNLASAVQNGGHHISGRSCGDLFQEAHTKGCASRMSTVSYPPGSTRRQARHVLWLAMGFDSSRHFSTRVPRCGLCSRIFLV